MTRTDMSVRTDPAPAESNARLALHVLEPRSVHVIDRAILVGRSAECDVVLANDTSTSRVHLRLVPEPGGVRVTDIDSRTGTFIDGRQLHGTTTVSRGVLRIGDTVALIAPAPDDDELSEPTPLVGGASLAQCRRIVSLIAPTELPLLIIGEPGTGKKVVARWAHLRSGRAGMLVAVNCAALPDSLLEAELFGHVNGARGLVASAAGGTLFLDEVGELPLAVQAKLLRVLDDRAARPVGANGSAAASVDVRVISATNVDLRAAVERGTFRADLYARLSAVEVGIPRLRSRIEDVPLLVEHLLHRAGLVRTVTADALEALARYSWPQNVRQLDFTLRRATALSPDRIDLEHLGEALRADFRPKLLAADDHAIAANPTRDLLEAALREHRGNVRRVGQALGIPRSRLYRLLGKWSIDVDQHRASGASSATE